MESIMAGDVTTCVLALQAVTLLLPLWNDRVGVLAFVSLFGLGFAVVPKTNGLMTNKRCRRWGLS